MDTSVHGRKKAPGACEAARALGVLSGPEASSEY